MALAFAYLAGVNLAAFLLFGWDKRCAMAGARRIPEKTLLGLAAIGGGLGGVLAQQAFRHKSSKASFQAVVWITVLLNCAALAWLARAGTLETLQRALPSP